MGNFIVGFQTMLGGGAAEFYATSCLQFSHRNQCIVVPVDVMPARDTLRSRKRHKILMA